MDAKEALKAVKDASHVTPEMICCLCECIAALEDRVSALEANIITPEKHEDHHKKKSHH